MSAAGVMYSAFNTAVSDFMADISSAFPMNVHLAAFADMHGMGSRANVRMPFESFAQHVMGKYGDRLRNVRQDDSFFMSHTYGEVNDSSVVDVLKTMWRGMTAENRECVLDHLTFIIDIYDHVTAANDVTTAKT